MEKYSVLMSLYIKENPEHLKLSIQSMLDQTVKPDEIVIVKDGPITNDLQNVLDYYENKYKSLFHIVGYEKNHGLGYALNYGLRCCKNEIVARMDTDDISKPDRCEQELYFFDRNPNLDIVGGNIEEFIDAPSNIVGKRIVPTKDKDIKEYMKTRCAFNHMSVMYKKSAVLKAGNYKDWFWNEDYYLWIRMMTKSCKMANTGTVLVTVRVGTDMYKRRGGIKYFRSEKKLQEYMLKRKVITLPIYLMNVGKRLIVEVLLPNSIRGWVFQKFARS